VSKKKHEGGDRDSAAMAGGGQVAGWPAERPPRISLSPNGGTTVRLSQSARSLVVVATLQALAAGRCLLVTVV
jgi:hypothetical protein